MICVLKDADQGSSLGKAGVVTAVRRGPTRVGTGKPRRKV